MTDQAVIDAIDESPLNRGLSGAAWIAEPGNIAIHLGGDISLFDFEAPGVYQMHVLYRSRGRNAVRAATDALAAIFNVYDAELIFALVPNFRRDVKMLARWTGLKYVGRRKTDCGVCELFVISKTMWKKRN